MQQHSFKNHYLFLAVLTAIWVVMIIIANPIGNFPLNDDWMYARSVFYLITQGKYKVTESYSPVLISQVGWGLLFCLFKGFSFTALRISTLVLGLIGIFFLYFLVNNLTRNRKLAFFSALLLPVNPLYFSLSNSFMTDVPFLSVVLISVFYFFKEIQTHERKYILIATLFSILATLIRQLGVVIPLAYAIVAAIEKNQTLKQRIKHAIPLLTTLAILILALVWLNNSVHSQIKFFQSGSAQPLFKSIFPKIYTRTGNVLIYSGIFLFPGLVFIAKKSLESLSSLHKKIMALFVLLVVPSFISVYNNFPCANMVNNGFIGPNTLWDSYVLHTPDVFNFSSSVLLSVFLFGCAGAILILINFYGIVIRIYKHYRSSTISLFENAQVLLFAILCVIGYCLLVFPPELYFDRYILPCIPLIWIIICPTEIGRVKMPVLILAGMYLFCVTYFTTLGTHDWLEWNRARWKGVEYLTKEKNISADIVDAGYEANGWLLGGELSKHNDKTWWFVYDNKYMLAKTKVNGYQIIKQFYYTNYFPYEQRSILVLQKN
jgi:4-amino-4-deoxy-L-arabinose transferase-like glycosyltransferase